MSARIVEWMQESEHLGRGVVAIGVFDGVHVGHTALIRSAVERASEHGVASIALTFDRDPEQVIAPDKHVPQLLTLEDKLDLISMQGIDMILVVPFCHGVAEMPPKRFVTDVLLSSLDPEEIVIGSDFKFGHNASGDVALLKRLGAGHGFDVRPFNLVEVDSAPVTATRIRKLIAAGDVSSAARLLGRPHRVSGTVVHGRGEGESVVGFPSANVTPWTHAALPADGVYAGWARFDDSAYSAAISVGLPPMYPEAIDRLEAHLLDFTGDLYNTQLTIHFESRLRDSVRFDSPKMLAEAIAQDVAAVRTLTDGSS